MTLAGLVIGPALAGALCMMVRENGTRRAVFMLTALLHLGMVVSWWYEPPRPLFGGVLALDDLGLLFLSIVSVLFLAAAIYGIGYLRHEQSGMREDFAGAGLFQNAPEARFTACLLFFLSSMTLVCVSRHVGLLWVGVEATTLASAPLIYFHRQKRSLEATWKYLMICSVGIAVALLGNMLLALAFGFSGQEVPMTVDALAAVADKAHPVWLQAAFIFILVGYGTKMGLAPMHTWLPDAHSEAPSLVSALLSGALLNCAFLGILRVYGVVTAAGLMTFANHMLIGLGLLSMCFAAVFILGQADYKRMLAYSSVEHMGLLALGVGLGAGYAAMLHAVNHSLTKALLFMIAGNILAIYKTKSVAEVRGVTRVAPLTGALWVAGFLAITGSPPFGLFVSEYLIVRAAFTTGHVFTGVVILTCLAVIFIGMSLVVLRMSQGEPGAAVVRPRPADYPDGWPAVASPAVLALAVLVLGLYVPPLLREVLAGAAASLIGGGF